MRRDGPVGAISSASPPMVTLCEGDGAAPRAAFTAGLWPIADWQLLGPTKEKQPSVNGPVCRCGGQLPDFTPDGSERVKFRAQEVTIFSPMTTRRLAGSLYSTSSDWNQPGPSCVSTVSTPASASQPLHRARNR